MFIFNLNRLRNIDFGFTINESKKFTIHTFSFFCEKENLLGIIMKRLLY